jgi:hypothetical protein
VRGIIRAGGALAGAQIIVPFGGLFTAALLPAFIGLPRAGEWRKYLGVLVLLLFMPCLATVVLAMTKFQPAVVSGSALQSPRALASATAAILLVAISEWPVAEHRARSAIALSTAVVSVCWIAIAARLL